MSRRRQRAERHLARLKELKDHCCDGNATAFARTIGVADTYGIRLFWDVDKRGRKGLGNDMISKISETFGLCPGWFDLPLGTALPPRPSAPIVSDVERPRYDVPRENEEDTLIRAFRLADPAVRQAWMDQARGIILRHDTPSQLTGTDPPSHG